MSEQFDLDADLFLRVRAAVGIEETRYYLGGVFVEPIEGGGAWLVATDGRGMLVARDETAVAPHPAVICLTMPETAAPAQASCDECYCAMDKRDYTGARIRAVFTSGDKFTVARFMRGEHVQGVAVFEDMDCADKYPKWRKVWSSATVDQREGAAGIDADRLSRLAMGNSVIIRESHPMDARVLLFPGVPELVGLLMPMVVPAPHGSSIAQLLAAGAEGAQP